MLLKVDSADEQLVYTLNVLYDTSLIRSGYDVSDALSFAKNVEKVVRKNLMVDEKAESMAQVKPAPHVVTDSVNEDADGDDEEDDTIKPVESEEHDEL